MIEPLQLIKKKIVLYKFYNMKLNQLLAVNRISITVLCKIGNII